MRRSSIEELTVRCHSTVSTPTRAKYHLLNYGRKPEMSCQAAHRIQGTATLTAQKEGIHPAHSLPSTGPSISETLQLSSRERSTQGPVPLDTTHGAQWWYQSLRCPLRFQSDRDSVDGWDSAERTVQETWHPGDERSFEGASTQERWEFVQSKASIARVNHARASDCRPALY